MARKEAQLRRLRSRVLAETTVGKNVVAFVEENTADLSGALMEDEDVFGLAVRLIEPWLRQKNNFEILEAPIDSDTVQAFTQLADRLAKVRPTLGEQTGFIRCRCFPGRATERGRQGVRANRARTL